MKNILKILLLSLAGVLFAGYLSFFKIVNETCALSEGCSYFLGFPTCFYGFVMFAVLLIASFLLYKGKGNKEQLMKILKGVSLLGILFSAYFGIQELFFRQCLGGDCSYALVLPTCVYGLVVYVLVFWLARKG
jgi:uncharacterized membrane protein